MDLPTDLGSAAGISEASQAVVEAVARGDVTPGEGATLAGLLEGRRKVIETKEMEKRIAALEAGSVNGAADSSDMKRSGYGGWVPDRQRSSVNASGEVPRIDTALLSFRYS